MVKTEVRTEVKLPEKATIFLIAIALLAAGILGWNILGPLVSLIFIIIGSIVIIIIILGLFLELFY
ncbi:MAG: hypothetical protein QW156_03525 [Candidatus Aenigmatarchaeota archaeon]